MFATTGALAPQRSAERKVRLRKGEGVGKKTQAKTSNSSVFNYVKSTSSYPRGGVEYEYKTNPPHDKKDTTHHLE